MDRKAQREFFLEAARQDPDPFWQQEFLLAAMQPRDRARRWWSTHYLAVATVAALVIGIVGLFAFGVK